MEEIVTKKNDVQPFEEQLELLEGIVSRLEDDSVGLEEALELFEKGMTLARSCRQRLESVEEKVRILLADGATEDLDIESS